MPEDEAPYVPASRPDRKRFRYQYRRHAFDKLRAIDLPLPEFQPLLEGSEVSAICCRTLHPDGFKAQATPMPNCSTQPLCGHLVPTGAVHALLAERRRALFPDEMFGGLFPSGRGRLSVATDVVASVMVLQAPGRE